GITEYFYDGHIEQSLEIINGSSGMIATRFHSMILGWIFNKPVFPFVYSNKTLNVLNDLDYEGYYLAIENMESIDVENVVSQAVNSQPTDIRSEIDQAHENFLKFDQFMDAKSI